MIEKILMILLLILMMTRIPKPMVTTTATEVMISGWLRYRLWYNTANDGDTVFDDD